MNESENSTSLRGEDLRTAVRAVKDAIAGFSHALAQGLADVGTDVSSEITGELTEASRELAHALDDKAIFVGVAVGRGARAGRAESTRADLIAAARQVFADKGYEAASVADLASAAGYTKGALYAHFPSKEALFLAVIEDAQARACEDSYESVGHGGLATDDDMRDVMLSLEAYLYALRHPEQRAVLAPLAQTSLTRVIEQLRATREGAGDLTTDDRDNAMALSAVYAIGSIMARILPDDADVAGAATRITQRLLGQAS